MKTCPGNMSHLQEQFEAFHRDNPRVWVLFRNFTLRALHAGVPHLGAKAVYERLRWHVEIETRNAGDVDGRPLKLNNNYTAFYARMFQAAYPHHADFFHTRHSKADGEIVGATPRHNAEVNV